MKNLLLLCILCAGLAGLTGCGKTQEQIALEAKEKAVEQANIQKAADLKKIEDAVKYELKDAESAQFRNVIGNCGEVNSKNSYGAYAGFGRFIFNRKSSRVIFESAENIYFNAAIKSFCDKEYLDKFSPKDLSSDTVIDAAPIDAAPIDD